MVNQEEDMVGAWINISGIRVCVYNTHFFSYYPDHLGEFLDVTLIFSCSLRIRHLSKMPERGRKSFPLGGQAEVSSALWFCTHPVKIHDALSTFVTTSPLNCIHFFWSNDSYGFDDRNPQGSFLLAFFIRTPRFFTAPTRGGQKSLSMGNS